LDEEEEPYRRFQFTLEMSEERDFNLSLYTCAADRELFVFQPFEYNEQFGYDVEMLVTDSRGTQSFRIPNNAGGCWATFPVRSGEGDVLVEIRARGNNATQIGDMDEDLSVVGDAVLSAIAFDALEDRTTRMAYNDFGQLIGVVDGLGNTWAKTYDETDGTLVSSLEPGQIDPTLYFYEDDYKNLTSVEDPLGGLTVFEYDLNGNVVSVTDADEHTTNFALDGRNRVILVQDALGNQSQRDYDAGGRLVRSIDQANRETRFAYMRLSYIDHPKIGLNLRTLRGGLQKDGPDGKTQLHLQGAAVRFENGRQDWPRRSQQKARDPQYHDLRVALPG